MNVNIANNAANTWKRIKLQHVTAVAGAALALSGAIAVRTWESGESVAHTPLRNETAPASLRPDEGPRVVYYLVESPERADRLAQEDAQARAAEGISASTTKHVFVVTSETETTFLTRLDYGARLSDPIAQNPGYYVSDLRGR